MAARGVAVLGALLQTALGTLAGCGVGLALGWPLEAGVMLGLSVSIASTVVLIKNLADAGLAGTDGGRIATGWLIVEDLLTVVILVVLPVLFGPGEVDAAVAAMGLGAALAKTALFVGLMFVVGSRALPHMLIRIARFCPRGLFQLAVIVVALGTAVLAAWLFDLSFALGAFLAGVVVGGSKISHRVAAEAIPFQDLFSIIFFASVGMMVNPGLLIEHVGELALLLGLIVVGKWAINMLLGMMFRAGLESTLTIAGTAVPDTNLRWMTVSANGVAAGSTLADLQLRAKTGAQAVALRRDDEIEFAIEADMPLCAGDILGLAGSEAQIEAALALLGRGRG